jgi:hypothetical protein
MEMHSQILQADVLEISFFVAENGKRCHLVGGKQNI